MRTFYTLVLTQTLSLIGSRISSLAIGIQIFADTGQATPLALVSLFTVLPMVLASSLSGLLADRWDRRRVMILADAGQAVGTVLLLLSFVSGSFELWHLYLVAMIQSIFGVFQGPAFMASVTMLVPEERRDRANAITQMTSPTAGIVAPALAGVIFGLGGVIAAILVDLATFLAAMVVVFLVDIPRPPQTAAGQEAGGSMWREMLGGLSFLLARSNLLLLMLYISFTNFMVTGIGALITPYILARTGNDETALGVILSVMNVGAIAGAIVIGAWGGTRPRMHTIMPALVIAGIVLALVGTAATPVALAVTLFAFLAVPSMINPLFMSIMQTKVPPDLQGRVFALLGQVSMLLTPLSFLLVGPLVDLLLEPAVGTAGWSRVASLVGSSTGAGMGLLMVVSGSIVAVTALLVYALPGVRRLEANLPDYVTPQAADAPADERTGDVPAIAPEATG
jgi:MFS family permease